MTASDMDAEQARVSGIVVDYTKRMYAAMDGARAQWQSFNAELNGTQDSGLGAINNIEDTSVRPWIADSYGLTAGDQGALDKWVDRGNEILASLKSEANYGAEDSFPYIITETANATVEQVKQDVHNTLTYGYVPYVIAGVVVLIALALFLRVRG